MSKPLSDKLLGLSRQTLYLLLVACATIPLFFKIVLPNKPDQRSIDLFAKFMSIPEGSTILIESDWSLSTRGESGGQFEALMRILMRRNIKFAIYSVDAINMQVARNYIRMLSDENVKAGGKAYVHFEDWVDLGTRPNLEGTLQSMANDFYETFKNTIAIKPDGTVAKAMESPVLANVRKIQDMALFLVVTGTGSYETILERMTGKVDLAAMVTGVMGPETVPFYESGQFVGLSTGLKGVYDIETLMEKGFRGNSAKSDAPGRVISNNPKHNALVVEGFPGKINMDRATKYYPTLHFTLALMILMVILGNVGLYLSKKQGGGN